MQLELQHGFPALPVALAAAGRWYTQLLLQEQHCSAAFAAEVWMGGGEVGNVAPL